MRQLLKRLARKARGVMGLGVVGGVAGLLLGGVWGVVGAVARSGIFFDVGYLRFLWQMALGSGLGFAMIGAFTASGFGVLVAAADSRKSLEDLPLWRMGLFGALMGAVFPPVLVISRVGLTGYLGGVVSLLPVSAVLGLAGGLGTASLVAIAKRAERAELPSTPPGGSEPVLSPPDSAAS